MGGAGGLSGGAKAGIAIAVIIGVLGVAAATWFIRRRTLQSLASRRQSGYMQNMGQARL